jgi:hypothetical protein
MTSSSNRRHAAVSPSTSTAVMVNARWSQKRKAVTSSTRVFTVIVLLPSMYLAVGWTSKSSR